MINAIPANSKYNHALIRWAKVSNFLKQYPRLSFTAVEIAEEFQWSKEAAMKTLNSLCIQGCVTKTKGGKFTTECIFQYVAPLPKKVLPPKKKRPTAPPKNLLEVIEITSPLDHPVLGENRTESYYKYLRKYNKDRALLCALRDYPDMD
jgi:hypothetical protein